MAVPAKAEVRLAAGWVAARLVATVVGVMGAVEAAARVMVVGVMGSAAVVTGPTSETCSARGGGGEAEGPCPAHRLRRSRSWQTS